MSLGFQRIAHDAAWLASQEALRTFAGVLLESEQPAAFEEFYRIIRAAVEAGILQQIREQRRLFPSKN